MSIDRKVQLAKKAIKDFRKKIIEQEAYIGNQIKKKLVLCEHCEKRTRLDSLIFVQQHYYEPPTGCTGGAYWVKDNNSSYFICPKCESENRICCRRRKDEELLLENKRLFLEIWLRHDYSGGDTVITKPGDKRYKI